MTPAVATQLSYYYASITGLDPNTVWMSMMMGQYMQEDAIAKAVATAVQGRGSSGSKSNQGSPSRGQSPKSLLHSSPKTGDKTALKYLQTMKGLSPQMSSKSATVTSSSAASSSQPTPPPAHQKSSQGASYVTSTPKPGTSSDKSKSTAGSLSHVRDNISTAAATSKSKQKKKKLGQQHESLLRSIMTSPLYLDLQARAQAKINQMKKTSSSKSSSSSSQKAERTSTTSTASASSTPSTASTSKTPTAQFSASLSSVGSPGDVPTPAPVRPRSLSSTSSPNTSSVFQSPTQPKKRDSDSDVIILESDSE